jgi:glycylpeptide N-tetradecanoyltransferase
MAFYKFWKTQPVPQFGNMSMGEEGPIETIRPELVPTQPDPLISGFQWATVDLENEKGLHELCDLLENHYVEDDDAMFRFKYSTEFLSW